MVIDRYRGYLQSTDTVVCSIFLIYYRYYIDLRLKVLQKSSFLVSIAVHCHINTLSSQIFVYHLESILQIIDIGNYDCQVVPTYKETIILLFYKHLKIVTLQETFNCNLTYIGILFQWFTKWKIEITEYKKSSLVFTHICI